jgi:hypothetical protein
MKMTYILPYFPAVTDIQVSKPSSKIYCDDNSTDKGFPYARPIICQMSVMCELLQEALQLLLQCQCRKVRKCGRLDHMLAMMIPYHLL